MNLPIVSMTRIVSFSAGHRYWSADLTEQQNRERFGSWASPYNHGHNYVLHVVTEGPVDPINGMVVNIKIIDAILQREIVGRFNNKSLNDESEFFASTPPSIENILQVVWKLIDPQLPRGCALTGLKLEETPLLYGELILTPDDMKTPHISLTRTYEFAAAHRLYTDRLPHEENVKLYGKCSHAAGHGHNYVLEVTASGAVDPTSGMMFSLDELDRAVESLVVDRYDHRNLDVDIPELQGKVSTSENVALAIFGALDGHIPGKLERIKLFETARNAFEVRASS